MIKFDLNPNEQIVLTVRKHWITIAGEIALLIAAAIIPFLLLFVVIFISNGAFQDSIKQISYLFMFGYAMWLLVFWVLFFLAWTEYFLDVWVVTTHRIFTIEQKELFNREVSSFTLDKIQNITIDVNGFIPTMLKFGTITIETAAERREFELVNARDPEAIKIAINDIQKKYYNLPQPVQHVKTMTTTTEPHHA